MKHIQPIKSFLENVTIEEGGKGNTNLITDICIAMLLINPNFLDDILDNGQRTRYSHNTKVFINDLKNMVTAKNRLKLGVKIGKTYEEDDDAGKVNTYFNQYSDSFDMEKDWGKLMKARDIARNIQDKILIDSKLTEDMIECVYWVSPNKEQGEKADLVIETKDKQYPLVINSRIVLNKTQSFNKLVDLMIDQQGDKLFTDMYLDRWNKLTQEWFKLVYNSARQDYKIMMDQFIDASRADSLTYFDYFDITIQNPKYKHLGQYFPELGKNYKELNVLVTDIWKQGIKSIQNYAKVKAEWDDLKKLVLNNKIIEHLIVDSLNSLIEGEVEKEGEYIIAQDKVKMRLLRVLVNMMGVEEVNLYFCNKADLYHIPSRQWFRNNYDELTVYYDYHQKLTGEEEDNDSQFNIKLKLNDNFLMNIDLYTGFSGGEMTGRLNTKMVVDYVSDFNSKVA